MLDFGDQTVICKFEREWDVPVTILSAFDQDTIRKASLESLFVTLASHLKNLRTTVSLHVNDASHGILKISFTLQLASCPPLPSLFKSITHCSPLIKFSFPFPIPNHWISTNHNLHSPDHRTPILNLRCSLQPITNLKYQWRATVVLELVNYRRLSMPTTSFGSFSHLGICQLES